MIAIKYDGRRWILCLAGGEKITFTHKHDLEDYLDLLENQKRIAA